MKRIIYAAFSDFLSSFSVALWIIFILADWDVVTSGDPDVDEEE